MFVNWVARWRARAARARAANAAAPTSLRSLRRNAISVLSTGGLGVAIGFPVGGVVTAIVPTDMSCSSVVDAATFELLNEIITYSDAVPSPPRQSDAIWARVS